MNSIGLQNPGVQHFIDHELPAMRRCGTTVWANLGGHTIEENVEGVQMLCAAGVDFIELNISCPNVKQGGLAFGIRAADAGEVVSAVRKVCTVPLIVKLSPQAESIPEMCKAVEAAGADASACATPFRRARSIWKSAVPCSTTRLRACPARRCVPSPCAWSGRPWGPSASPSWDWAAF